MNGFSFADPAYLFLIPLALLPLWSRYKDKSFAFSQLALVIPLTRSWRLQIRPLLPLLEAFGMALLIVALARPQLSRPDQIVYDTETAVIFALDISNSMKAQDLRPNRLSTAKQMIETIVTQRPTTQFGLVLFAQHAYVQLPPTYDHALFLHTLDQVNLAEQIGLPDGTALGAGIATAANLLTESAAEKRQIVLFTDGVNTEAAYDPVLASQAANQLGIQVQAIAVGQPGLVPFPQPKTTGDGNVVFWESPLNEAVLQTVAEAGGGFYGRATDENPIRQLTEQLLVATAVSQPATTYQQIRELYSWLLAAGLFLLLTSHSLRQTVLRQLPEMT